MLYQHVCRVVDGVESVETARIDAARTLGGGRGEPPAPVSSDEPVGGIAERAGNEKEQSEGSPWPAQVPGQTERGRGVGEDAAAFDEHDRVRQQRLPFAEQR